MREKERERVVLDSALVSKLLKVLFSHVFVCTLKVLCRHFHYIFPQVQREREKEFRVVLDSAVV